MFSKWTEKEWTRDTALLGIRLILAVVFIYHGGQKLFGLFGGYGIEGTAGWMASVGIPFATLSAVLAGSAEFFGGLALLSGLGVRLAAVPMTFTMLVASFTAHSGFDGQQGGMEYPLTLAVVLGALVLLGGGRWTLAVLWNTLAQRQTSAQGRHAVIGA